MRLTYTPVPHTPLYQKVKKRDFILPDPFETLEEMKVMIENISISDLKFVGTHASNYLPINDTLQRDKEQMIFAMQSILDAKDMSALRDENMRGL